MANPQAENGYTRIANEIVEHLAKIRISGEEMQILWVVLRKTYGWNKKMDAIPLSQFTEMTGIKRSNVCRAIKKLVSKKILRSLNKETRTPTNYMLNKDFDQWEKKVVSIKRRLNKETSTSLNIDNQLVSKKRHSKDNLSKDTTKDIVIPEYLKKIWPHFVEMRKKMRRPLTNKAIELTLIKLNKLAPNNSTLQIKILEQSIENSYLGVFQLKNNFNKGRSDFRGNMATTHHATSDSDDDDWGYE